MDKNKKYTWNFGSQEGWLKGAFDSIEKCLEDAKDVVRYGRLGYDSIFIAEAVVYAPVIDAESVIEDLKTEAMEEYDEHAYSWLDCVNTEAIKTLSVELTKVFQDWLEKHNEKPYFYHVYNAQKYSLEDSNEQRTNRN